MSIKSSLRPTTNLPQTLGQQTSGPHPAHQTCLTCHLPPTHTHAIPPNKPTSNSRARNLCANALSIRSSLRPTTLKPSWRTRRRILDRCFWVARGLISRKVVSGTQSHRSMSGMFSKVRFCSSMGLRMILGLEPSTVLRPQAKEMC